MDGYMDGCMYGWVDVWTSMCMGGCMYEWMYRWMGRQVYGWIGVTVWVDRCIDGWVYRWTGVCMYVCTCVYVQTIGWMGAQIGQVGVWMGVWTDPWVYGWVGVSMGDRWVYDCMYQWIGVGMYIWVGVYEYMDGQVYGWMVGWLNEWIDGQMNRSVDGQLKIRTEPIIYFVDIEICLFSLFTVFSRKPKLLTIFSGLIVQQCPGNQYLWEKVSTLSKRKSEYTVANDNFDVKWMIEEENKRHEKVKRRVV